MGATAAEAQVDKKCYRNQTAGWQSVVKLDHLGAQRGTPVAPGATVWLTDDEAVLTARAPADPKDNPFEEQNFMFQDDKGVQSEHPMRPLILVDEERYSPSDERFVPGQYGEDMPPAHDVNLHQVAAEQANTEAALSAGTERPVPTEAGEPVGSPPVAAVPGHLATAPPPEEHAEAAESWTENAERTEEPQPGSLSGSHEPAPGDDDADPVRDGSPTHAPPQRPAPAPVATSSVAVSDEETAAQTAAGEETGAAEQPAGAAPEGEFAKHEEVGTPDAPAQGTQP